MKTLFGGGVMADITTYKVLVRCARQQIESTNAFENIDGVYIMEPGVDSIKVTFTTKWLGEIDTAPVKLNWTIVCGGNNFRVGVFSFKDWLTEEVRKYMIASQFWR